MFICLKWTLVSLNLNSNFIGCSQREWEQVCCEFAVSSLALIYHSTIELSTVSWLREGHVHVRYLWRSLGPYLVTWIFFQSLLCIPHSCNSRWTIYFLFIFCFQGVPSSTSSFLSRRVSICYKKEFAYADTLLSRLIKWLSELQGASQKNLQMQNEY